MKRAYLVPNTITAFSLACGLFVIFKVNMIEPGFGNYEMVYSAALLLLVAALADFLDGAVARAIRAESQFGMVFDSLADAISFGVAPSVLLLKTLSLEQGTFISFFSTTGAMVYSLCGVLRLVRFSAAKVEEKGKPAPVAKSKFFTGLPIPAAAASAVSANLFFLSPLVQEWLDVNPVNRSLILACVMIVLGYLMVSRLKFPSLKSLRIPILSFHVVFLAVIVAVFVLYGILYFFPLILTFAAWGYVITSFTLTLIRLIAGKKSKTLEDFEPEPNDFP